MTTTNFTGLGKTQQGRTRQLNKVFKGMAAEMKRRQAEAAEDAPMTTKQYEAVIADLKQQLADAQALIEDMRAQANSDEPVTGKSSSYWTTAEVAQRSGVAISTICRHAKELNGIKHGVDWLFPVNTIYGRKRKSQ